MTKIDKYLKNKLLRTYGLLFVSSSVLSLLIMGQGQQANAQTYSRGGGVLLPTVAPSGSTFELDNGIKCPTPSLNVGTFLGSSNDFANARTDNLAGANAGQDNYGFTIGFNVPLGGRLGEFCREVAATREAFEKNRLNNTQAANDLVILENCVGLINNGITFNESLFKEGGVYKNIGDLCRPVAQLFNNGVEIPPKTLSPSSNPFEGLNFKDLDTTPFSPSPVLTTPTQ